MNRDEPVHALVLAAGLSTRLRSARTKVLQPLQGEPLVRRVVRTALHRVATVLVVVSHQEEEVRAALSGLRVSFVRQPVPRGTADAVRSAVPQLRGLRGTVLILCGDAPLVRPESLGGLLQARASAGAPAAVLTALLPSPAGYGRIVRDAGGRVARIVEEKDATEAERRIHEVNTGSYAIRISDLLEHLPRIGDRNAKREFYLTDLFEVFHGQGRAAVPHLLVDPEEAMGINTRADLSLAHRILWRRKAAELLEGGVTLLDPEGTWIDEGVEIGQDTEVHPCTILAGRTRIGPGCRIGPWTRIRDSELGPGVEVLGFSDLEGVQVREEARVGPFARLRPGSVLEEESRVGNFVELKKTRLGRGSKANHLAYLGDAEVGPRVNVGAGTITCNYDGEKKHPTVIGEGAFIGTNASLVAPLSIGRGAYVAAGSTITEDVPADALALGRARQSVKAGWAGRRRKVLAARAVRRSSAKGKKKAPAPRGRSRKR